MRNLSRIESTRLPGWNYATGGWYFVTVCAHNLECFFGNIVNGKMQLSDVGEIVADEWQKTEKIRLNVKLDEWIVMPNHIHGIIIIQNKPTVVETHCNASLQSFQQSYQNKFGPQQNNLSSIIRGFKSATTKRIHLAGYSDFSWQQRFYDHIIRDEESLNRIREYIINNPMKWELDKNNPENLYM